MQPVDSPHRLLARENAPPSQPDPVALSSGSRSAELTLDRLTLGGERIPKRANAIWFHRDGEGADLPDHGRTNIVSFVRNNPSWHTTVWTDDVPRLQRRFAGSSTTRQSFVRRDAGLPRNLRIVRMAPLLDAYAREENGRFAGVVDLVKAARPNVPAAAKDLASYMVLDRNPGLFFDVDTAWPKRMPDLSETTLRSGVIGGHGGFENNLILCEKAAVEDGAMRDVLARQADLIPKHFDRVETADGMREFRRVADPPGLSGYDWVSAIGAGPFAEMLIARDADPPGISRRYRGMHDETDAVRLLGAEAPDTSYGWFFATNIAALPIPERFEPAP